MGAVIKLQRKPTRVESVIHESVVTENGAPVTIIGPETRTDTIGIQVRGGGIAVTLIIDRESADRIGFLLRESARDKS